MPTPAQSGGGGIAPPHL